MKKKFFILGFLGLAFISLFNTSCNENADLINFDNSLKLNQNPNVPSNVIPLPPNCLNETVVDSFIYYMNEFNNYLLQDTNKTLLSDSLTLINLANNAGVSSFSEFCSFVSNTFNIPLEIVKNTCKYSAKVMPFLERETVNNHPIADRWYSLIKTHCISTILPQDMFLTDTLQIELRKCGFWNLFWNCASLAGSCASAVLVETWTLGVGTVVAVGLVASGYGYYHAIKDCL